jgi:hypothetical protein
MDAEIPQGRLIRELLASCTCVSILSIHTVLSLCLLYCTCAPLARSCWPSSTTSCCRREVARRSQRATATPRAQRSTCLRALATPAHLVPQLAHHAHQSPRGLALAPRAAGPRGSASDQGSPRLAATRTRRSRCSAPLSARARGGTKRTKHGAG